MNAYKPPRNEDARTGLSFAGPLVKSAVALVLALALWWTVVSWYEQRLLADTRQRVHVGLLPYGNALTTAINERLGLLSGLEAFVLAHLSEKDLHSHFDTFAAGLSAGKEGIRSVQVFPLRGPVLLYPVAGNEATVGRTLQMLINDERAEVRADVRATIASRLITLSGPYELRQGGLGLVARLAIYVQKEFWGMAVIVFDLPPILKLTGLHPLPRGLSIALRDEKGRVFAGDPAVVGAYPVTYEVPLPDGVWRLAAVPPGGWKHAYASALRSFQAAGLLPVVLFAALVYALSSQSTRLKRLVATRTEALNESEQRFRAMFEQAPLGVALLASPAGPIDEVNRRFTEIAGRTREEMTAIDLTSVMHPDDLQDYRNKMALLAAEKIPGFNMETRYIHPDGSQVWVNATLARVTVVGKERPQHLCMIEDISARRRAEEALRQSEEKHRCLFETMAQGVVHQAADGKIISANPAAERILGLSRDQLLGRTSLYPGWKSVYEDGSELPGTEHPAMVALRTGRAVGPFFMGVFHPKKNTHVWLSVTAIPLFQPGETTPFQVYTTFEDLTEHKRAEGERKKLQAQLIQAQKMESVGRLAGGVAHDFNNMLGVILGRTEMALEQVDPAQPLFTDLQEIRKAADRSADLTRQLLAFARKQTVAPKILDINETVEGMLKMLRRLIGEDIELAWLPGTDVWPVMVDPAQIDQILANLCVNARDAIGGVGKVTIETENVFLDKAQCAEQAGLAPGDFVLLAVSDDGSGMDRETLGNIFEPFFTTKRLGQGTGLGLSTVYGIVKQNNGFINVYSEPGRGTTFKVYLPRHTGKGEQIRRESPTPPAVRGHETILLVEDEPAILEMTTIMLESQGYRVLPASTPGAAIRTAREHAGEIHLLMTDVVMPEMNGRDLAKNLLSLFPDLKRLFMSGYTANVIAHHGVLDQGVHFIQKPFLLRELAAKVCEALEPPA